MTAVTEAFGWEAGGDTETSAQSLALGSACPSALTSEVTYPCHAVCFFLGEGKSPFPSAASDRSQPILGITHVGRPGPEPSFAWLSLTSLALL
jgi:hypothetical protein